jgi:hypothetical protein
MNHRLLQSFVNLKELIEEHLGYIVLEVLGRGLALLVLLTETVQVYEFVEVRVEFVDYVLVDDVLVVVEEKTLLELLWL